MSLRDQTISVSQLSTHLPPPPPMMVTMTWNLLLFVTKSRYPGPLLLPFRKRKNTGRFPIFKPSCVRWVQTLIAKPPLVSVSVVLNTAVSWRWFLLDILFLAWKFYVLASISKLYWVVFLDVIRRFYVTQRKDYIIALNKIGFIREIT